VSTDAPASGARAGFDLDRPWQLHPQVSVRPERFGALLYHFGTRRLSFLKSPALLTVVSSLADAPSARAACQAAGVSPAELPAYATALETLASSQMIRAREVA
jgi:mycofactocin biosynthesis protein MftB